MGNTQLKVAHNTVEGFKNQIEYQVLALNNLIRLLSRDIDSAVHNSDDDKADQISEIQQKVFTAREHLQRAHVALIELEKDLVTTS